MQHPLLTSQPELSFSLNELVRIAKIKETKFPNLDNLIPTEFTKLQQYFPTVTPQNYPENEQIIRDYFDKLVANDLISEVPNIQISLKNIAKWAGTQPKSFGAYDTEYNGQKLNSEEFWFVFYHIRMKDGILKAKGLCEGINALQNKKIPEQPNDISYDNQTKNDAMRHCILTAMIAKYGGQHYGSVNKACDLAIEFTDLHEIDTPKNNAVTLSHLMDKNNNRVGAEYFRTVGYTVVVESYLWGLIKNRDVRGPDDNIMLDALFNKGFKKGLFYYYLNYYFNTQKLVYLREPIIGEPVLINESDWPKDVPRPVAPPKREPGPSHS